MGDRTGGGQTDKRVPPGWEPLDTSRVWATCLAIASLGEMDECVLADSHRGEEAPEDETIVDRATLWLAEQAAQHPLLDAEMDAVMKAAKVYVTAWQRRHDRLVRGARAVDAKHNKERSKHDWHHAQARTPCARHTFHMLVRQLSATVSCVTPQSARMLCCITRPPAQPRLCASRFYSWCYAAGLDCACAAPQARDSGRHSCPSDIAILGMFTVNIWFFYSKAAVCCMDVRSILGCGPDPTTCRGYDGECADLPDQVRSSQVTPLYFSS